MKSVGSVKNGGTVPQGESTLCCTCGSIGGLQKKGREKTGVKSKQTGQEVKGVTLAGHSPFSRYW